MPRLITSSVQDMEGQVHAQRDELRRHVEPFGGWLAGWGIMATGLLRAQALVHDRICMRRILG